MRDDVWRERAHDDGCAALCGAKTRRAHVRGDVGIVCVVGGGKLDRDLVACVREQRHKCERGNRGAVFDEDRMERETPFAVVEKRIARGPKRGDAGLAPVGECGARHIPDARAMTVANEAGAGSEVRADRNERRVTAECDDDIGITELGACADVVVTAPRLGGRACREFGPFLCERFEKRTDEPIVAIFHADVGARNEGKNERKERDPDRRIARDNRDAFDRYECYRRAILPIDEMLERIETSEFICNDRADRRRIDFGEERIERVIDHGLRVAGPFAERSRRTNARREIGVTPSGRGVGDRARRADDGARHCLRGSPKKDASTSPQMARGLCSFRSEASFVLSHRTLAMVIVFAGAASLAACGGGGGGSGGPGAPPTPTPAPTNGSARPAAIGDAFTYAGTFSQTFVRPPITRDPVPSPNPANTLTLSYTIAQSVTVAAPPASGAFASATFDIRTVESDLLLGGLKTLTTTTDAFETTTASGTSTIVRALGSVSSSSDGTTFQTTFGVGNGLIDILPETTGPVVPTNTAAVTISERDPTTQSTQRTTNADGTATLAISYPDGTTANGSYATDGSGTYSLPLIIPRTSTFVVGAPRPNPAGTPFIPITITYAAGLFPTPNTTPTPTIVTRTVAVWYPQPLVLAQASLVDNGSASIPAECNVGKFARSGNQLVETRSSVDPILGEVDLQTTTSYTVPGVGVACVQLSDVATTFYDFSRQTSSLIRTQSTPDQITTTLETLGITQATVFGTTARTRSLATERAFVTASGARFAVVLAQDRAHRRDAVFAHTGERGR